MASDDVLMFLIFGGVGLTGAYMFIPEFKAAVDKLFKPSPRAPFITPDTPRVAALNDQNLVCDVINGCSWVGPVKGALTRGPRVSVDPTATAKQRARDAFCELYGC